MGLFDKLKNVFIEEDFDEDIPKEKKEKKEKKEIKVEEIKEEPKEEIKEVVKDTVSDDTFSDRELLDTKEKFKFPIIFEDDDFKEEKKKSKSVNVLERETIKYEPEIRKDVRKEKKVFKPSPVISPVYGVLDKNYSKDDITTKDGLLNDVNEVDIDYVIKKASGEYSTREEKNSVEEDNTPIELFVDVTEETKKDVKVAEKEIDEETVAEVDEKIKSIDELLKDTTDDDFYSLVDSMYKDDEGEEE